MTHTDPTPLLIECFSAVFPDLDEADFQNASMTSVDDWNSLATVTLITIVQEEFNVDIAPDDLGAFVSFRSIVDYLRSKTR